LNDDADTSTRQGLEVATLKKVSAPFILPKIRSWSWPAGTPRNVPATGSVIVASGAGCTVDSRRFVSEAPATVMSARSAWKSLSAVVRQTSPPPGQDRTTVA